MSLLEILLIIGSVIAVYVIGVYILRKKGLFEKYNISFYGPALLLRTKKGVSTLRKIAQKKRFWRGYGTFAVLFCFIMMILMVGLLILNTWAVLEFTPEQQEQLPGIEFGLVIPGLNPILPLEYLVYILLALVIAVIVHEFSHGILTFAHDLKVKSLGILYLILPLGAFCEPDEEQLKKTDIKRRMHVYAAGPMSNFAVAIIIFMVFSLAFMGSVQTQEGVHILYNIENSPADTIDLTAGSVITEINGTTVTNVSMFTLLLHNISINKTVPITYYKDGTYYTKNVTLVSQYTFTDDKNDTNDSFLGVGFNLYANGYLKALQHPLTYAFPDGLILVYSLPFFSYLIGYNPIVAPFTGGYIIQGPLSYLPTNVFWIIVNALYWIFWLNLVVGLFNVLPMIPLDGGFLLSDALRGVIKKLKGSITEEKREYIVRNITLLISLVILFVVLFPWIIKYF